MKTFRKNILLNALVVLIGLTSCFDEKEEDYKIIGAVGTVSVMTVTKSTPTVGEQITVNIRYFSENVAVKQLRLTQTIGSDVTVVATKDVTGFDINNSYVDTFTYTVPAAPLNTVIKLTTEIETVNNLTNSAKFVNITVK
ncbi:hypothetical protein KK083_06790 [Fulvivirgaceae bacterium PWU4]|uniref:Uncharacterized protein n=1 Tax=Chryseosolibacter histidini TaxID=2782349 RepID=A0AAP2DHQ6_9BACT|nr:hypothetical protein [Chryseosolibacter histidini]MBT1696571.1 hypothetical protein [Chryseosolibacter histidini]